LGRAARRIALLLVCVSFPNAADRLRTWDQARTARSETSQIDARKSEDAEAAIDAAKRPRPERGHTE
jgi:hypothetical protein